MPNREEIEYVNPQTMDEVVRDLNKMIDQLRRMKHDQTQISNNMFGMTQIYNRLLDKIDVVEGMHSIDLQMQEKIAELREWKKKIDEITPPVILVEMVAEMKENRKYRMGLTGIIAALTILDLILKFTK